MFTLIAFGSLLVAAGGDSFPRSHYNHLNMPPHGSVHKGMLYGFFADNWSSPTKDGIGSWNRPYLDGIPLKKSAKKDWKKYEFIHGSFSYNFRHSIGHGCLWFSDGPNQLYQIKFEEIQRFDFPNLSKKDWLEPPRFFLQTLRDKYAKFYDEEDPSGAMLKSFPVNGVIGYGSVPTSASSCKCYILYRKTKMFETWDSRFRWDDNNKNWEVTSHHENLESFNTAFLEDFYFFVRKNDYYFVTESGRLFYAPPREPGEKWRTMRVLWDDAKRPIIAVIEDADQDKVWLFAKNKNAGAKRDLYFEMKETILTESFDPAKLRQVNVEGRAKTLLEYLPLIYRSPKK
jgi:hypothetical protein